MPGKGKVEVRVYTHDELEAIQEGASSLGLTEDQAINLLGEKTYDIYLNDIAYWKNVPENVWNYHIGGYQVIKKWLSYREKDLLGRSLTIEEVREVMNIARRIAAIILLGPELNKVLLHKVWVKQGPSSTICECFTTNKASAERRDDGQTRVYRPTGRGTRI